MSTAHPTDDDRHGRAVIASGAAVLGIELGSTNVKAVLVDARGRTLASGSTAWENRYEDGRWTYAEEEIWGCLAAAYAAVAADAEARHGVRPTTLAAAGISAMMHGYLALDAQGRLLVPFRTWRNTSTGPAAGELSELFDVTIPLRWSVAHLYQAILDDEPHVADVAALTTLSGLVHRRLTGAHVLGVGDASGMFPVAADGTGYDPDLLARFDALAAVRRPGLRLADLLPAVLPAGREAGRLTSEGAALLDPSGTLRPGVPLCPPEGDAGTGMVATNAVAPRTGNVSVGTSIFAMLVLESPLRRRYPEIDLVTTPAGDPVAMVHCNNGASELDAWAGVLHGLTTALGTGTTRDEVFGAFLGAALEAPADAGGILAYNYLAGEPVTGLEHGRPLVVRTPDSRLTLGTLARAQLQGAFATLALGMEVIAGEDVAVDVLVAHGGLFRTEGPAQRLLAAALDTPVSVGASAGEGGAWGIAVLACHVLAERPEGEAPPDLGTWLSDTVFRDAEPVTVEPEPADVEGFARYLERYRAGLEVERAAILHT